jgi:hypothetical protein
MAVSPLRPVLDLRSSQVRRPVRDKVADFFIRVQASSVSTGAHVAQPSESVAVL